MQMIFDLLYWGAKANQNGGIGMDIEGLGDFLSNALNRERQFPLLRTSPLSLEGMKMTF